MYIKVRVTVGARAESFEKVKESHYVASVREKAKRNMANARVIELVAAEFGISPGAVRIVSGHHSPSKLLSIPD